MSIKIASMNFGDCDTILHNTPNGMKNIAEVLGPNGEVYWSSTKELTGIPPLSIRSNGTMLLDYLISGNMVQTGTPTPQNPIQPQETGERTGNLFDYKSVYSSYINANGDIATTTNNITSWNSIPQEWVGKTITISCYVKSIDASYVRVQGQVDGSYITGNAINSGQTGYTEITITPVSTSDRWCITYGSGTVNVVINQVMVEESSTRTAYQPYGIKIPISSGGENLLNANTTISGIINSNNGEVKPNFAYGTSDYIPMTYVQPTISNIYLGEVETTRSIKKLVLTGEENWSSYSGVVYLSNVIDYLKNDSAVAICTHYQPQASVEGVSETTTGHIAFSKGSNFRLCIRDVTYTTGTAFKSYLAQLYANGMPVTIWYVLATPETGIVNEPLRKIGDYADTLSMEQAGVQIPTNRGNTVIDVETTLKPSQMYIKYK